MSALSPDSLERIVPQDIDGGGTFDDQTLPVHLERYRFAARHVRGTRILDMACGVGYGTQILAEAGGAAEVVGVDLSEEAITYAKAHYTASNIRFEVADAIRFADDRGFDTIVSLETIVHLSDPAAFVRHLTTLLAPGGTLIGSVPTTPSVDLNPHHRTDFTDRSFRRLGHDNRLVEADALKQIHRIPLRTALRGRQGRLQNIRRGLLRYYAQHPGALDVGSQRRCATDWPTTI